MVPGQGIKVVGSAIAVATQATNATQSLCIDTLGFNHCLVQFVAPPAAATNSSTKWQAAAVYEASSTTFATTYTVLAGTTQSTAATNEFVLNAWNDTTYPNMATVSVRCGGPRRRYLHAYCVQPNGNTAYSCLYMQGILSQANDAPDSSTEMNVAGYGAI